jgi:tryptophan synthase
VFRHAGRRFTADVLQMGTTGSVAGVAINTALPELIARIRSFTPVPLAVGFGVSDRTHFDFVTSAGADGVVIGSKIISVIEEGEKEGKGPAAVEAYCRSISLKGSVSKPLGRKKHDHNGDAEGHPSPTLPIPANDPLEGHDLEVKAGEKMPSRFGLFGGAYVPESLVDCLSELEDAYVKARNDPEFWKEFESMFGYMNRPSNLYLAERLTEEAGGCKIWLK